MQSESVSSTDFLALHIIAFYFPSFVYNVGSSAYRHIRVQNTDIFCGKHQRLKHPVSLCTSHCKQLGGSYTFLLLLPPPPFTHLAWHAWLGANAGSCTPWQGMWYDMGASMCYI